MTLNSLISHLKSSSLTREVVDRIKREDRLTIRGGNRGTKAIISTAMARLEDKPLLLIAPTLEEAGRWLNLLEMVGWGTALLYPTSEGSPYDQFDPTSEIVWGQLQVLSEILIKSNNSNIAIVSTERCLQPHLPPKDVLKKQCLTIKKGEYIDLTKLGSTLTSLGYERVSAIEEEGSWSRRGDIIDIFPVNNELPVRLELFGDEIEKIKEFDTSSQKSLDQINEICLTPTSISNMISNELREYNQKKIEVLLGQKAYEELKEGLTPEGMKRFISLAWECPANLLDYISKDYYVVVDERSQCNTHCTKWTEHANEHYNEISEKSDNEELDLKTILPNNLIRTAEECNKQINSFHGFDLTELENDFIGENHFNLSTNAVETYANQFGKTAQKIKDYQKENQHIWIISSQPSRACALLEEHDCFAKFIPNNNDLNSINKLLEQKTPVALKINSNIDFEGLHLKPWKIVVITDREFFGRLSLESTGYIRRRNKSSSKTLNPNKINPGDFIVHRTHGIGRFIKMEKFAISNQYRDYLVVEYLDGLLRVAADQLGSLGRYRSNETTSPKINKMGGASWLKAKERASKAIKKVAADLIRLYAERLKTKGYAFPPDGPWQRELEDSFPYETTPDQKKAADDVKNDMEKNLPMDRLICGDVGFGKTEVAIRAIFKAITSGKQVAFLAPTTILSQQHWRTLSDRFSAYPIKLSLLNRFRTSKEKEDISNGLRQGKVDLLIGTHLLLNKKIQFKDLGLLVVDEEQRFGVKQKEKIKSIKSNVDVLTLSATPIPRTLYMSLSGVREMSLITTPPPSRRPIKTHLAELDSEVVRSAIRQEIDRGGQVFYVVPRIQSIERVATDLRQMLPTLKLIVAHGQMHEGELENAMVAFNAGEADLMLCTTIVESGLDIPRVNTILIEDAHKFGLAQLYQLRGRVGRSGVQAHAWLFYPTQEKLSANARQRLRAIQEFTQLGSGYQLAMRDMEIRGVGNLLGVEQSGQMELIGFDLYMEMLQEELANVQGEKITPVDDTQIDLPITAFIPADWITDSEEKISAYRAASDCKSMDELFDLAAVWTDRYGSLPKAVESLIVLMKLKLLAKANGFSRIRRNEANIIMDTQMEESAFRYLRKGLPSHLHGRLIYQKESGLKAKVLVRGLTNLPIDKQLEQLIDWFSQMSSTMQATNDLQNG